MPTEYQQVRIRKIRVDVVRVAKSKAALVGQTLEDFLAELITKALHKDGKK